MRISTNQIQLSMLDNLQQGFGEYARLDRQISSNKRILQPSDDPVGSVQLLGLKKEQAAMAQYQKNIANAKSQLSQGEIQLETMTNMLSRLRDLTQTAATGFSEGQAEFTPAPKAPASADPATRAKAQAVADKVTVSIC